MTQYAALHKRILERQQAPRYVVFVANPEYGYGNKYDCTVLLLARLHVPSCRHACAVCVCECVWLMGLRMVIRIQVLVSTFVFALMSERAILSTHLSR
jgi:hypothetical protein